MTETLTNVFLEQGILGACIVALVIVVVYQQLKSDKKDAQYASEIKELNAQLLAENKSHTVDYREMAKDNQEILNGVANASNLLAAKLESKGGN